MALDNLWRRNTVVVRHPSSPPSPFTIGLLHNLITCCGHSHCGCSHAPAPNKGPFACARPCRWGGGSARCGEKAHLGPSETRKGPQAGPRSRVLPAHEGLSPCLRDVQRKPKALDLESFKHQRPPVPTLSPSALSPLRRRGPDTRIGGGKKKIKKPEEKQGLPGAPAAWRRRTASAERGLPRSHHLPSRAEGGRRGDCACAPPSHVTRPPQERLSARSAGLVDVEGRRRRQPASEARGLRARVSADPARGGAPGSVCASRRSRDAWASGRSTPPSVGVW